MPLAVLLALLLAAGGYVLLRPSSTSSGYSEEDLLREQRAQQQREAEAREAAEQADLEGKENLKKKREAQTIYLDEIAEILEQVTNLVCAEAIMRNDGGRVRFDIVRGNITPGANVFKIPLEVNYGTTLSKKGRDHYGADHNCGTWDSSWTMTCYMLADGSLLSKLKDEPSNWARHSTDYDTKAEKFNGQHVQITINPGINISQLEAEELITDPPEAVLRRM
jgi:hypothetical protein